MAEKTIFQMIIDGEVPCTKVYEDDVVLAFLDIQPIQPGHTLVVPKKPSVDARETDPESFTAVMQTARTIAKAMTTSLNCDGVNISLNCGRAAGQEVFHTHAHVIPRFDEDGVMPPPLRGEYAEEEATTIATTIAAAL